LKTASVLRAWTRILAGYKPVLSIEITKECPLRCPGCYAFDADHLGPGAGLRSLSDYRGPELVSRVLALVDRERPLQVSIVGGDPLVRYRELDQLLPELEARGIYTQVVTSAFRVIPREWQRLRRLTVAVSIDGLQPEHDERRHPATYERILRTTAEASITIHSTITGLTAGRPGYLEEFVRFWSARPQVRRIWFSLFTPQIGARGAELLAPWQRDSVVRELLELRRRYAKIDMAEKLIREMLSPPSRPEDCIFARTTRVVSADLRTAITPCQFGGSPDCSQCGCIASMGLAAVGKYHLAGGLTAGDRMKAAERLGAAWRTLTDAGLDAGPDAVPLPASPAFRILES
jgi:MoaA/NifB/PqqE/SkfB family radical SAM enzyme